MTVELIKISKGKIIKNKKGNIIKFIDKNNALFKKFGEIYFSEIKLGQTKGWNYHKRNTCLLMVTSGKVKFSIYNEAADKIQNVILSEKNNTILQIPPNFWFSFKSFYKKSKIVNIVDNVHSANESIKSPIIRGIKIK